MRISDWSSDVCSSDLPVDTLAELIAYAKAHPGEITFATSGIGSIQHIGTEQLARHAGVEMLHIPYGGAGPAMNDMLGERGDLLVTPPPAVVGQLQAGAGEAGTEGRRGGREGGRTCRYRGSPEI